jgi:hypothetical protein
MKPSGILILVVACVSHICVPSSGQSRKRPPNDCSDSGRGLHATLNADHGHSENGSSQLLVFLLMNDSDHALDSAARSWALIIDDHPASDRGGQLWTGPGPIEGYGTLRPGASYEFGKELSINQYFPEVRDYKVYWKSAGFRSNVAVVRGGSTR